MKTFDKCIRVITQVGIRQALWSALYFPLAESGSTPATCRSNFMLLITIRAFGRRFYPKCLTSVYTHLHTDGRVNHARRQPAPQEQLGLSVLIRDKTTLGYEEP